MRISKTAGVSVVTLVMAASGLCAPAAFAQDTAAADEEPQSEVVVVGTRKALKTAQDIKRNADTVVDSITATDIGAFPDKSVAEALQRVPGVSVIRSAAKDDVMHYSAEPSGVIIRGLPQVRSEFNGRDTFSATSGYGLSWSDVPPEMMAGVDTYKNMTAEMIEGGIAGSVNLRTRTPFDSKGRVLAASAEANYGNFSESITPSLSALYSDRWQTDIGEFGLLLNGAYSKTDTTSHALTIPRMVVFAPGTYTAETNYIPSGIAFNKTDYERTREGVSLAAQWQNNDRTMRATLQYNSTKYENTWNEDQLISYWFWVDPASTTHSTVWNDPAQIAPPDAPGLGFNEAGGGTPYTFGSDGLFQNGVITRSKGGWGYGAIDWSTGTSYVPGSTDQYGTYDQFGVALPVIQPCIKSDVSHANQDCRGAPIVNTATRYSHETRKIDDVSLNFVWDATDKLRFNFDAQMVKATTYNYDITFEFTTYADLGLDLTGKYPALSLLKPSGYNVIGTDPLSDARNYSPESAMDHITDSEGELKAVRADMAYEFEGTWLDALRAGVRFADRKQTHLWSSYNWASIASDWGVNPADSWFLDSKRTTNPDGSVKFQGYEPGYYETREFGGDMFGGDQLSHNQFVFMSHDIISNPEELAKRFAISGQTDEGGTASSGWNPICERPNEVADSCFTAGERLQVREKTDSAYVMLKFGGADAMIGDFSVSGNAGVRFVNTTVESLGAVNFATPFTAGQLVCTPLTPEQIAALGPNQYAISPGCLAAASTEDQAFSNGGSAVSNVTTTHKNVLPSFNLRVGVADDWFVRFAASRAISKPDIGLLRNFMTLNRSFIDQADIVAGNPNLVLNSAGQPVSYKFGYTGTTGNPRLKPVKADQFDLAVENYFDTVGSMSFTLFYKKFDDYIQNGTFVIPYTNNGVTRDVVVTGPVNGEGATIKGFEAAYQRYFTFLPAPFDGLGVQANYTHIKNSGVKNANLIVDSDGGVATARSAQSGMINAGRLENLSDDAYNLIVMYEKGKVGARLAYNWRSEYVSSVNDCCIGFPVWNDAEGFLDASFRYALTNNIELSVQGSNLLGTEVRIRQQVAGPTNLAPNTEAKFMPAGWFEYDKRIQVGVRFKY
ncbi:MULTISPECIES: TonB-dependent receptor [Asticcacaulis]|uniref:TonB-dependent receptor n=1 Tax=Asticcacaulis TaxID=76890 RepID=UPI001AE29E92|nr:MULTISPECIES: TonB-dependent receptor [Asticcacaulis]MBP2161609.1 TonB-dependent receptor [Asticcacaulis solisilvae]MDR6802654.1 TonB-dependent receptor [Asticcacaulis sp. BE141]